MLVRNMQWNTLKRTKKNAEKDSKTFFVKIFRWVVQHHGYEENFLNPEEVK